MVVSVAVMVTFEEPITLVVPMIELLVGSKLKPVGRPLTVIDVASPVGTVVLMLTLYAVPIVPAGNVVVLMTGGVGGGVVPTSLVNSNATGAA